MLAFSELFAHNLISDYETHFFFLLEEFLVFEELESDDALK